jgi:SAM-dependent methyltransferase
VTEQQERYDRIAAGYARWWAPVLAPTARALLDEVEPHVAAGARRILDVGTGTGTLALAAVERWDAVEVTAIDASEGMLAAAETASEALDPATRTRVDLRQGYAASLPAVENAFDLVMSSFVLQLVPSRAAALRDAYRVLRPGGTIALVTWLRGGEPFAPDRATDAAFDHVGFGPRESDDGRTGDPASPAALAQGLRRAGFTGVRARAGLLAHQFTPESYVGFVTEFDEEDLVASLSRRQRTRFEGELLRRLRRLRPADLQMRLPIVIASGRRPG